MTTHETPAQVGQGKPADSAGLGAPVDSAGPGAPAPTTAPSTPAPAAGHSAPAPTPTPSAPTHAPRTPLSVAQQLTASRLGVNRYHADEGCSHLEINQDVVKDTGCGPVLVAVCPAHVYSMQDDGSIKADYVGCLECGTCRAVAPEGALIWHYPRGGKGIAFRQG